MKHSPEEIGLIREYFELSNNQIDNPDNIYVSKDVISSDDSLREIEKSLKEDTEKLWVTNLRMSDLEEMKSTSIANISSLTKELNLINSELELDNINSLRERNKQRLNTSRQSYSRYPELPLKKN